MVWMFFGIIPALILSEQSVSGVQSSNWIPNVMPDLQQEALSQVRQDLRFKFPWFGGGWTSVHCKDVIWNILLEWATIYGVISHLVPRVHAITNDNISLLFAAQTPIKFLWWRSVLQPCTVGQQTVVRKLKGAGPFADISAHVVRPGQRVRSAGAAIHLLPCRKSEKSEERFWLSSKWCHRFTLRVDCMIARLRSTVWTLACHTSSNNMYRKKISSCHKVRVWVVYIGTAVNMCNLYKIAIVWFYQSVVNFVVMFREK